MKPAAFLLMTLAGLSACASKPRTFEPALASAPSDAAAYEAAMVECRRLVAEGRRSDFGGAASAGAGAAAGYATGAALMAGTGSSLAATTAAASVAVVAMPVVGIVAAVGVSRAVRARREREINTAMTTCLAEKGFSVSGWTLPRRSRAAPASAAR